jgi:membrane protease subunit (stomatin/prohibitin family)
MGPDTVNGGGGSSVVSDMLGLGVGMAAAGTIMPQIGNMFGGAQPQQPAAPQDDMAAFKAKVEKLSMMKDAGLLTDEEFAQLKADLLKSIL